MEDIFIKRYPQLDLHGYDRDSARLLTNDFIDNNIILKNEYIVIIHGKGYGIVKESVHEALKTNRHVLSYHVDSLNSGITVVKLQC